MPAENPIRLELDLPRTVRWTMRAEARLSRLDYTIERAMDEIVKPRQKFYVICLLVWAALQDREHPFTAPEEIAEYLDTDDKRVAAVAGIKAMLIEAELLVPEHGAKKKSVSGETTSEAGPGPSSN